MKYSPENGSGLAVGVRGVSERRFGLKRATDEAHARLEEIVQSGDMFASVEGYRRYLAATWAMRERFEHLLDTNGAAEIWPEWPSRRIAALAADDMADLHLSTPPQINSQTSLTSSELLGVLYVLEGSSLGACILVRMVSALGFSHDFGARHLFAHASSTSAWRSFIVVLDASPQPPCHQAANGVFNAFADAYQQARP